MPVKCCALPLLARLPRHAAPMLARAGWRKELAVVEGVVVAHAPGRTMPNCVPGGRPHDRQRGEPVAMPLAGPEPRRQASLPGSGNPPPPGT